jgi:hypothetical protein
MYENNKEFQAQLSLTGRNIQISFTLWILLQNIMTAYNISNLVTHSSFEMVQKYSYVWHYHAQAKKSARGCSWFYCILAMALKSRIGVSVTATKIPVLLFLYPTKAYFPCDRFSPTDGISSSSQF